MQQQEVNQPPATREADQETTSRQVSIAAQSNDVASPTNSPPVVDSQNVQQSRRAVVVIDGTFVSFWHDYVKYGQRGAIDFKRDLFRYLQSHVQEQYGWSIVTIDVKMFASGEIHGNFSNKTARRNWDDFLREMRAPESSSQIFQYFVCDNLADVSEKFSAEIERAREDLDCDIVYLSDSHDISIRRAPFLRGSQEDGVMYLEPWRDLPSMPSSANLSDFFERVDDPFNVNGTDGWAPPRTQ